MEQCGRIIVPNTLIRVQDEEYQTLSSIKSSENYDLSIRKTNNNEQNHVIHLTISASICSISKDVVHDVLKDSWIHLAMRAAMELVSEQ